MGLTCAGPEQACTAITFFRNGADVILTPSGADLPPPEPPERDSRRENLTRDPLGVGLPDEKEPVIVSRKQKFENFWKSINRSNGGGQKDNEAGQQESDEGAGDRLGLPTPLPQTSLNTLGSPSKSGPCCCCPVSLSLLTFDSVPDDLTPVWHLSINCTADVVWM